MIFVDEPILAAYGSSAYLSITEDDVHELVGEVLEAIDMAGAISGIHICGNSDWGVVLRSGVAVLNFDAYQYGTRLALYPDEVQALLDRGGWIAWGIVPTSKAVRTEDADSLARRFEACLDAVAKKGFAKDLVRQHSLLTPSCGAGPLAPADGDRVFQLLRELHQTLTGSKTERKECRKPKK